MLWFFLTRHPCRIVTTSAKADHLRVLWGEMMSYIQEAAYPLDVERGGPLHINHLNIRRVVRGQMCPLSYLTGMVAAQDSMAAMQGHHIAKTGDGVPRTLFVSDESSSVPDAYYTMASTWFNRAFIFGNTWPCDNFFKRGVEGGDLSVEGRPLRRVVRIRATDSPNVKLGLLQKACGEKPTDEMLIPGVKSYSEYCDNLVQWDEEQKSVSLEAEFYKGASVLMFPPAWLARAQELAMRLRNVPRRAKSIGIDPAEGGDKTAMVAVDEHGLVERISRKTPNTAEITGEAIAFARKHDVSMENVVFDRGGGGKQHADRLRAAGYPVRTVAFGEACTLEPKRGIRLLKEKKEHREERYAYVNRRAEMYGELMELMDPCNSGFAMDDPEIRSQLAPIPKKYDPEGRLKLLPKNKRSADSTEQTLTELVGHSPDEADALVLAVHGMLHKSQQKVAGAVR